MLAKFKIPFELAEIGKNLLPTPAGCAQIAPLVIVAGKATIHAHAIDVGSTTDTEALDERDGRAWRYIPSTIMEFHDKGGPVKARVVACREREWIQQIRVLTPGRRGVRTRFDQQDVFGGIFRKSTREYAPGGPSSRNDDIVRFASIPSHSGSCDSLLSR
jgi:hypothetical protein